MISFDVPATFKASGPTRVTTKRTFIVITNPKPPETNSIA